MQDENEFYLGLSNLLKRLTQVADIVAVENTGGKTPDFLLGKSFNLNDEQFKSFIMERKVGKAIDLIMETAGENVFTTNLTKRQRHTVTLITDSITVPSIFGFICSRAYVRNGHESFALTRDRMLPSGLGLMYLNEGDLPLYNEYRTIEYKEQTDLELINRTVVDEQGNTYILLNQTENYNAALRVAGDRVLMNGIVVLPASRTLTLKEAKK